MAEDFPRFTPEDDDDSSLDGDTKHVEHHDRPTKPEGIIFKRLLANDIVPSLPPRPMFNAPAERGPEVRVVLPSVSVPEQPEVRIYQPPIEAEVPVAAQHEALESDAEDDDDEDETEADGHARPPHRVEAIPDVQVATAAELSLNKQFEKIMHEMGEDFMRSTSGEHLGEDESSVEPEPVAASVVAAAEPPRRTPLPTLPRVEWRPPLAAEAPESPPVAAPGGMPPPPTPPTESAAFYYDEGEPEEPEPVYAAAHGMRIPRGRAVSSNASVGAPMGASRSFSALEALLTPPAVERREDHNGRWFAAGVLTGWLIKQHIANKKLTHFQKVSEQEIGKRDEQINALGLEQQTLQRQIRRSEGQALEAQAMQTARENQARRAEAAQVRPGEQAMRPPTQFEQPAATVAAMPQQPVEQARPYSQAPEQRQFTSTPVIEAPLQRPGTGETIYTARPAMGERPANRPLTPEALPKPPVPVEQTPQAAAEELVAKAYELQAGQHLEHATGGGHNIIVDKHGHEVQNAIEYGKEFQFQRRQERARAGAFSSSGTNGADSDNQGQYGTVTGLVGSGQVDSGHSLPSGTSPSTARRHLLSSGKKENPIIATVASPWLWAALLVLLFAFFTAAFI
jgi:hypothetical protein